MLEETANDQAATGNATKGLSRRQMVKAGAWAAPVVMAAVASPMAVASQPLSIGAVSAATPTKTSGKNVYSVSIVVSHPSKVAVPVTVSLSSTDTALTFGGAQTITLGGSTTSGAVAIPLTVGNQGNQTHSFVVTAAATNHGNATKTVTFQNGSLISG